MIQLFQRIFLISFLFLGTTFASAQVMLPSSGGGDSEAAAVELPDPLTPEAVRGLVSGLTDEDVRNLLLIQLDAVAKAKEVVTPTQSPVEFIEKAATGVVITVYDAFTRIPNLYTAQSASFSAFGERLGWSGIGQLFGALAVAIGVGLAAEFLVNRLTRGLNVGAGQQEDTLLGSFKFLFFRLLNDLYGLIAFFIVTRTVAVFLVPEDGLAFAQVIMFNMVVIPRLGAAFARFLLAPQQPSHRLVHTDDFTAKFLHRHFIGVFLTMGFAVAIVTFNKMNGVDLAEARLGFWLNSLVHVYLVIIGWRAWNGLTMMMRGADPEVTPYEERFARAYPGYIIAVSIGTWMLVNILITFDNAGPLLTGAHYKMMFVMILLPVMDTAVRGMVRHLVPPMSGQGMIAERAYQSTKRSYTRIGRVMVFGLMVLIIANIWGLDPKSVAAAGVGAQFAGNFIEVLFIVAAGYLIWELVSLWINRKLAAEQTAMGFDLTEEEPGGGEGGAGGGSRLSTVLPLVLGIAKAGIATIFGLIALGNIGIDITPLLAGAGILGLAIGFGAQRLVADIVSGIFFLVDDAFRTGEYVEVEGTVGTVESISIRSMQLRHHKGPVHTIPFGEIPKITNYSRDWVIMKLKFTVPFDTDPNKVKKIFKKIGNDMINDDAWKDDFLQPFKSQGVFDFDDVGMIIRGKFMAIPGKQFMARKEIYNRVKADFEAAGIDFARREVRVALPNMEGSDASPDVRVAAAAAAAGDAARQQLKDDGAK